MTENLTEQIQVVESMTTTLDTMRVGTVVKVLNYQRSSANGTIQRMRDMSKKIFKCTRINNDYFTIKRKR